MANVIIFDNLDTLNKLKKQYIEDNDYIYVMSTEQQSNEVCTIHQQYMEMVKIKHVSDDKLNNIIEQIKNDILDKIKELMNGDHLPRIFMITYERKNFDKLYDSKYCLMSKYHAFEYVVSAIKKDKQFDGIKIEGEESDDYDDDNLCIEIEMY